MDDTTSAREDLTPTGDGWDRYSTTAGDGTLRAEWELVEGEFRQRSERARTRAEARGVVDSLLGVVYSLYLRLATSYAANAAGERALNEARMTAEGAGIADQQHMQEATDQIRTLTTERNVARGALTRAGDHIAAAREHLRAVWHTDPSEWHEQATRDRIGEAMRAADDACRMVSAERAARTRGVELSLTIDPGRAPSEVIAEVLVALSAVHQAAGGSGFVFHVDGDRVIARAANPVGETTDER